MPVEPAGPEAADLDKGRLRRDAGAAGVDRDDMRKAADELGVDFAEHVQFVIEAMRVVAPRLGLAGQG